MYFFYVATPNDCILIEWNIDLQSHNLQLELFPAMYLEKSLKIKYIWLVCLKLLHLCLEIVVLSGVAKSKNQALWNFGALLGLNAFFKNVLIVIISQQPNRSKKMNLLMSYQMDGPNSLDNSVATLNYIHRMLLSASYIGYYYADIIKHFYRRTSYYASHVNL